MNTPASSEPDTHILKEIERLVGQYGQVPPPWVVLHDTHPYDIGWRMGSGEFHTQVFDFWWKNLNFDESQRIEYFRNWPPPPRWLAWMIDVIWDLCPDECPEELEYSAYFERIEYLGFGTQSQYQADLEDPRWFENSE